MLIAVIFVIVMDLEVTLAAWVIYFALRLRSDSGVDLEVEEKLLGQV